MAPDQVAPDEEALDRWAPEPAPDQSWIDVSGPNVRGRRCNGCSACCTQVPVRLPDYSKGANERCPMLCSTGCRIYSRRPEPCQAWSCRWLFDADTAELLRPDKSGVVIDCVPEEFLVNGEPRYALQVWCDPKRRDAHRDPALRRYLGLLAERHRLFTLVRWSSEEAMLLVAPTFNTAGRWVEIVHATTMPEDMQRLLMQAKDARGIPRPAPEGG